MPFEPGVLPSRKVPRLVLVVDVSGSIDDALLQRFSREIEAITRRLEAGLTLVIGDDRVQHVQRFEPGRCDLSGRCSSAAAAAPTSRRCWKKPAATTRTSPWC
jgi:hypothetical protein